MSKELDSLGFYCSLIFGNNNKVYPINWLDLFDFYLQ